MASSLHGHWTAKGAAGENFEEAPTCHSCKKEFTAFKRRHHCRYCKHSFCDSCSPFKRKIKAHNISDRVRVCYRCRDVVQGKRTGEIPDMLGETHAFDYDLVVIGGGSGGLAAAKEAAEVYGVRVALCDYVTPSTQRTTWGLGGTCVNVGCIPKKLMHTAALLGESIEDATKFGWAQASPGKHDWATLVKNVQAHIHDINDGYIKQLADLNIPYFNAYAKFKDDHTVTVTDSSGKQNEISARRFLIAVGGRPSIPDSPGAAEHCITSDDLFSLKTPLGPGKKVLVVGASYVALECAGFLAGMGCDVTVAVRSIFLRGFDQECANKIAEYMEEHGTRFLRGVEPSRFEREEKSAQVTVTFKGVPPPKPEKFDTVLLATGRTPCTNNLGLCCAGVMRFRNGKIPVFQEQTNVPHIFALGDVASPAGETALELTPIAIHAGKLLARRLYGKGTEQMNYRNVATTVFTPLEYGCIGYTEDDAKQKFGEENIAVYHSLFTPLEMKLAGRMHNKGFCKLVLNKADSNRVVGFHFLGPNAGEITQGFSVAMRCGATKTDFDMTVGIHPTSAESLTTMDVFKGSGVSAEKSDC